MYTGADQRALDVVAAAQSRADIRTISWIDVNCVFQAVFLGQLDQLAGHQVIVWTAGILGADGDVVLGAGQVQTDAAHVDRDDLGDIGRNIRRAVADFLKDGDEEFGLVLWLEALVLHDLQAGQQAGDAALVVDEAGFEEAALGDNGLWIVADVVARLDAQLQDVLFVVNLLVDADDHAVLIPCSGAGIRMNVNCSALAEDGAGVNLAISGVDAAVFAVQGGEDRAADLGEFEVAVCGDGANHQAQGVDVRRHHDGLAVVLAFDGDDAAALFDLLKLIAQLGRDLLDLFDNSMIITAWAVDAKNCFCGIKQIILIICYLKNVHV